MTDLATLGLRVDATEVKTGTAALGGLTAAGGATEAQMQALTGAVDGLSDLLRELNGSVRENASATSAAASQQAAMARRASETAAATRQAADAARQAATAQREQASAVTALENRIGALRSSIDPTYAAQQRLDAELREATSLYRMGAISATEYATAQRVLEGRISSVNQVHTQMVGIHGKAAGSSKAMTQATLNLSRQFADVGVTAAMGMNPLMILIQQGPQIADAFQMAKTQGLGFTAVLRGMVGGIAPILVAAAPLVILTGAVAAGFGLMYREMAKDDPKKVSDGLNLTAEQLKRVKNDTITFGDTWKATMDVAGGYLKSGPIGDALDWLNAKYNSIMDGIADITFNATAIILGSFTGAVTVIAQNWRNLPAILGDATITASNAVITGLEMLLNAATSGLNTFIGKVNEVTGSSFGTFNNIDLSGFKGQVSGAGEFFVRSGKAAIEQSIEDYKGGMRRIGNEIDKGRLANARKRVLGEAGDAPKGATGRKPGKSDEEKQYEKDVKASEEFVKQLKKETAEIGLNAEEKRLLSIATATAVAPTQALKDAITEAAAAWKLKTDNQETLERVQEQMSSGAEMVKQLREESNLLRMNGLDREIYTARLALENAGIKEGSMAWQAYALTILDAAAARGQLATNVYDTEQLASALNDVNTAASNMADSMSDAFGRTGGAIGGVVAALTEYGAKMAEIEAQRAKDRASNDAATVANADIKATKALGKAEVDRYVGVASAAKGFFKEGSTGYRALQGVEAGYRTWQFAMEVKSLAVKAMTTAAKLPLFAAETAAGTAAGAASIFAALGPVAFPVVGAMLAIMAGLGGKGGSAGATATPAYETRQKNQGTGSVLGDFDAKSESLTNALEIVAENSNKDLEYSNQMANSLKVIQTNIGAVAAALSRSLSAGGALDTDKLGLGISGRPATLGNLGFGSTTNKTLTGQGIDLGSQSLSQILANGLSGSTFQETMSNTVKKAFGITYSNKTSTSTTSTALDADFASQLTRLIGSLRDGVLTAASTLGIEGGQATLNAMVLEIGKIDITGKTGAEIQEELNAVFSKQADTMAKGVYAQIDQFQKVGEGAFETLARVARGYQVIDTTLTSVGMAFGATGVASIAARERLLDLSGGIDQFASATSAYADKFLTEQERMIPIAQAVTAEMTRLGYSSVDTKDEFKALVSSLDLTTEKGATTFAALMAVSPAFAKVTDYINQLTGASNDNASALDRQKSARDEVTKAYNRESEALKNVATKLRQMSDSLKTYGASLTTGPAAMLSPEEQYRATEAAFNATYAAAMRGDQDAQSKLQGVSQQFLEASKDYYSSSLPYFQDLGKVTTAVNATATAIGDQATAAEKQLEMMAQEYEVLLGIKEGIVSLATAMGNYRSATAAVDSLKDQLTNPPATVGGGPGTVTGGMTGPDWDKYLATYTDVAAAFSSFANGNLRDYGSYAGLSTTDGGRQFAEAHYNFSGRTEGRSNFDTTINPQAANTNVAAANAQQANDNKELLAAVNNVAEVMAINNTLLLDGTPKQLSMLEEVVEKLNAQRRTLERITN